MTRAALVLASALAFAACPAQQIVDGACTVDADCGAFKACDPSHKCRCTSDDACDAATEFCNLAGSCQQKLECFADEDCATAGNPAAICDTRGAGDNNDNLHSTTGGQCVTLNASTVQCLLDSHCPFGFFCQTSADGGGVCQPGCRDNGDCPLGEPCINGQCDPTPGSCNEVGYCDFGQVCTNDVCQDHRDRAQLCLRCKGDDPADFTCPGRCLIDPAPPANLCSSDAQCAQGYCVKFPCNTSNDCPPSETCSGGGFFTPGSCSGHCGDFFCGNSQCDDASDPCPRGYNCFSLILVSNHLCTRGGGECGAGSACSADAPGELNENGACSCLSDGDCPPGVTCVNPGVNGACVEGNTCAPASGLTCEDLR